MCESRLPKTPHINAVRTALGSLDNAIDGVESPTVVRSPEEDDSAAAAHRENIDPSLGGQRCVFRGAPSRGVCDRVIRLRAVGKARARR